MRIVRRGLASWKVQHVEELSKVHQAQILRAVEAHLGEQATFEEAFPRANPCWVDRAEIENDAGAVAFELWRVKKGARETGSIFERGTAHLVDVALAHGVFSVSEGANSAAENLASALNSATQVSDPDGALAITYEKRPGQITRELLQGFNRPDAVPRNAREWNAVVCQPHRRVSEAFAERYHADFAPACWVHVARYSTLSEPFIRQHLTSLGLGEVVFHQSLSEAFLREFSEQLDWTTASRYQDLSPAMLREFSARIDWKAWSSRPVASELLELFEKNVDWSAVDCLKRDEAFLRRHADKLSWTGNRSISATKQALSLEFLTQFADRLDWVEWCRSSVITDAHLDAFEARIDWGAFSRNRSLTDAQLRKHKARLDWAQLINFGRPLSEALLREHEDFLDEAMWRVLLRDDRLSPAYAKEVSARFKKPAKKKKR